MGLIQLAVAAIAGSTAPPAAAQAPQFFYCYAVDAGAGAVYLSDTHRLGPVAERRTYGQSFSDYLAANGTVPAGTPAFCVMRARAEDIERAQLDLAVQSCPECSNASRFEQVAWRRGGETGTMLPAGLPQRPSHARTIPETAHEAVPGAGLHVMVRDDAPDMLVSLNETNGLTLIRRQAAERGGKWHFLIQDDRCVGWMAVTFATDGATPHYFLARGAETAEQADLAARRLADEWKSQQQGTWITGRLDAFRNDYRHPPIESRSENLSGQAIDHAKEIVRRMVVTGCARGGTDGSIGARG
ncbi:MAG TPA: hypothetical protein VFF66_10990 [Brevundimonas sp.]|nr:hypothetical protein [Brevundimonas sp.]